MVEAQVEIDPRPKQTYQRTEKKKSLPTHDYLQSADLANLNCAVFRGHCLALLVAYHQANQIAARFYVKAGLESNAGSQFVFQSVIFQIHGYGFFHALNEVAIAIKHSGHTR